MSIQRVPPRPKISVIVPVYNVGPYLARCLDSVIGNTYRNLEIICVNDGSTDNCPDILRQYEKLDDRIIIIDKSNGGISSARNADMDIASGEFIAFIDSDDWIHPQYFEILLHSQQITDSDIIICKHQQTNQLIPSEYSLLDISAIQTQPLSVDALLQLRFARNYVWGRLYRAASLQSQRFLEGIVFEDTPFNLSLISNAEDLRISLLSQELYFYYMRPTSIVHTASRINLLDVCQYYLSCITPNSSDYRKRILMEESIKKLLTVRYEASLDNHAEAIRLSNSLFFRCLCIYVQTRSASTKKKLQYAILFLFPQIYRLFRIKDDPTLLEWEKKKKNKRHT